MFAEACFAEKLALNPEDTRAFEEAAATRLPIPFPKRTTADPFASLNLFMDRKRRNGEALRAQISPLPSLIRIREAALPIGEHLIFERSVLVYR